MESVGETEMKTEHASIEMGFWKGTERVVPLDACGWVIAIIIRPANPKAYPKSGELDYRAMFTVHTNDELERPLFEMKWEYVLPDCGIALSEPIPNLNASQPLLLVRKSPVVCTDLTVIQVFKRER